jgi:hypothetical protein
MGTIAFFSLYTKHMYKAELTKPNFVPNQRQNPQNYNADV